MNDPKKVKPAKASGGAPTPDELDQFEVLNGLGVKIDPGAVQRLIEAARANAAPPPTPPPAPPADPPPDPYATPTRRIRRRQQVVDPEIDYRPLPPMRPRRRAKKPRAPAPVATGPTGEQQFVGWLIGAMVLLIGMPVIIMVIGMVLQAVTRKPTDAFGYTAIMGVVVAIFMFTGFYSTLARRSRRPPPPPVHDQEDDEDDDDASFRYRQERWQGDNGLNGRVGWENNGRAY